MNAPNERLLPEATEIKSFVDDPEFTEVTSHGEIYTLYRIVRMTHEITDHPDKWTHRANVVRVRNTAIGTAFLRIINREIIDAKVTITPDAT